tara:strand:- start:298 stop:1083 length:786 start_codon:yes stop_codon:yes gene_type:complete
MRFPKKSLGQNFLKDKNIIKKILDLVEIKNKNVIEIGPGTGALTEEIIKRKPKTISLIEKDNSLAKDLKERFSANKILKIYNEDILKFNIEKIDVKSSVIFGNLPYNISSQILVKFIKIRNNPKSFNDIIFMFQKELGEKIIGNYPSKHYGRLSILTNFKFNIINKFLVSPNCFVPKPKVTSMVIHFKPKTKKLFNINNINNLEKITNILFSNKRKMINKNIKKILNKNQINKIKSLNCYHRPAEINPDLYYKITEIYEKN